MPIKVRHTDGTWKDVTTGEFRVRNPALSTDWIYAAKVQICMNDGPGGANRWIDTGYLGVPNAPTAFQNTAWDYDSMQVSWAAPVTNGIPVSGYRVTVVQNSPAGSTRTFDSTTAMTQTFSVAEDTKYTVSVQAKGDTGVLGAASSQIKPWIGHAKISTFANVTKWKAWQSSTVLFSSGPPDTAIYRNIASGVYVYSGYKAEKLHVSLSGKYPWVPDSGALINTSDRTAEYVTAGAHYSNIPAKSVTVWTETVTFTQTTQGIYGIRLTGAGWSASAAGSTPATYTVVSGDSWYGIANKLDCTAAQLLAANPPATLSTVIHPGDVLNVPGGGPPSALTGSMYAIGQESYIDRVETVTRTEQKNALW